MLFRSFSVKILYRTKFSFRPKFVGMSGMIRNMPKFSFFSSLLACWKRRSRVGVVSEPCRRRVGACRRNEKKKKKEDTRRTPESGESYPFRCPTCVRHRHDAKNGVFVQPSICPSASKIKYIKLYLTENYTGLKSVTQCHCI